MSETNIRMLTLVCVVAAALLLVPTVGMAQGYGCQTCAAPAATGYVTYMPQFYAYVPTSIGRAVFRPTTATVYPTGCSTCYQTAYQPVTSYAYTTYRPLFGGNYQTRLIPYTTYVPMYTPAPVVAYSPCTSCVSYAPAGYCSPCGSSCGTATCGATSGCSSCTAPAVSTSQPTVVTPPPYQGNNGAAPQTNGEPQKTFQEEKAEKPVTDVPKPIPQTDTRLNSTPAPLLRDPRDRTAARAVYSAGRAVLVASPASAPVVQDKDGWRPARD